MNINQIKYCVSVFENQSFSVAARKRGVSVQAVSKAINDLENEIGAKLFNRYNRGASPTPLGRSFYLKARPALEALEELEAFSDGAHVNETNVNQLRIGMCAPEFDHYDGLFSALCGFVKRNAGVDVNIALADPRTAQRDLEHNVFDALVTIGAYKHDRVESAVLGALPTGVRVLKSHPLAGKNVVTLAELNDYPAIESPVYDRFNKSIFVMYRDRGLISSTVTVASIAEEDIELMSSENGYFFSAIFPATRDSNPRSELIPIDPAEALNVPICLISMQGKKSPLFHEVEAFLMQTIGQLSASK